MTEPHTESVPETPPTPRPAPPQGPAPGVQPPRKYKSRNDVSRAIEQLIGMGLNGTISPAELKVYQGALKTLADLLPKEGESATIPISDRLKVRLLADPELLEEMSALIPREQLQNLLGDTR